MNMGLNSIIGVFLPALIVQIAQWIGVLALRDQRSRVWWLMMIGVVLATVGTALLISYFFISGVVLMTGISFRAMSGLISTLGHVLFVVGFALHGLANRGAIERSQQLEAVAAAMGAELEAYRNPAPSLVRNNSNLSDALPPK